MILTQESRKIKPRENFRHFLIAVISILVIGALFFGVIYYGDQINKNLNSLNSRLGINQLLAYITSQLSAKPQVAREGKSARLATQKFSALYFADLEYDPKTGVTRQLKVGTARGDFPRFLSNQPKPAANKFIYRVEVLSGPKEIVSSGWMTEYKDIIQTPDGKLNFRVVVPFRANIIIKVYLSNNKLIWTGQTNKKETIL